MLYCIKDYICIVTTMSARVSSSPSPSRSPIMCPLAPKKQRVDADAGAGADGTPRRLSFDSDDVPSIGEVPVSFGENPITCPWAPKKQRIDADRTHCQFDFASDNDDDLSINEYGVAVSIDMHSSQQTSSPEENGPTVSFAGADETPRRLVFACDDNQRIDKVPVSFGENPITCPWAPKKPHIGADRTHCQFDFASDNDDDLSINEYGVAVSIDMHSSQQTSSPEENGPTVSFASALKALNVPVHL